MKIEVGKYYRTRDGRKVGPMRPWGSASSNFWDTKDSIDSWDGDGTYHDECDEDMCLIAEWAKDETGTTAELDVKPGDVVELVRGITNMCNGHTYTIQQDGKILDNNGSGQYYGFVDDIYDDVTFRIISRASDTPKTWGEMTDADRDLI